MDEKIRGQREVSQQVPLPTENIDNTSVANAVAAEVVTWFYVTSSAWASATGQAAGTIVSGKLVYTGVTNSMKSALGYTGDTSLVLAAATRLDALVDVEPEVFANMTNTTPTAQATEIAKYLTTNGQYAIDHRKGQIWGKPKAIVADDTLAYSYQTTLSGGGAGDKVDIIKVGGTSIPTAEGDNISNSRASVPTTSRVSGFNGTTWDRLRAGIKTVTATLTGWLNTLPWAIYNATPTTRTNGQGGPFEAASNGSVKVRGDGYDTSSDANKSFEVAPLSSQYIPESLVDTTNVSAATHTYDVAMNNSRDLSISGKLIDADGTLTLTVWAMNDEDTTSGDRIQIYGYDDQNNTTANSWTVTNGTLTFAISFNNCNYTHIRAQVVASGATNTVILKSRKKAL